MFEIVKLGGHLHAGPSKAARSHLVIVSWPTPKALQGAPSGTEHRLLSLLIQTTTPTLLCDNTSELAISTIVSSKRLQKTVPIHAAIRPVPLLLIILRTPQRRRSFPRSFPRGWMFYLEAARVQVASVMAMMRTTQ